MDIHEANIQFAKQEIEHRARSSGLRFDPVDIISVCEPDVGTVVFLRRFNPRPRIIDDNPVLDRDGKVITDYTYPMYVEYYNRFIPVGPSRDVITPWIHPIRYALVVPVPWLVFVFGKDDIHISHPRCLEAFWHDMTVRFNKKDEEWLQCTLERPT